jgi:hypothetical protein
MNGSSYACILGLRGRCGYSCDHVERELAIWVARLFESSRMAVVGTHSPLVFASSGEED